MTPLQRAYLLGYRRALARMRGELHDMKRCWDAWVADLKDVVDGIETDYATAKEVAKAMAERDPEVRALNNMGAARNRRELAFGELR